MGCTSSVHLGSEDFHLRYSLGPKLGEGSFGQVRAVQRKETRELRAVKVLRLWSDESRQVGSADPRLLLAARHEEKLWKSVGKHEHCVELLEVFCDDKLYYMVMEKCEASLMDRLEEMPRMSEACVARIFREMLMGIAHLHGRLLMHRDIKPANFLFGGESGRVVKLCDFGLAARLRRGTLLGGCFGTAPYMSPEMAGEHGHSMSTDVWSLGATAYVLLYGDFPYGTVDASSKAMKVAVIMGEPAPQFTRTLGMGSPSELAESFVATLLERNPAKRCTAAQALQLPFLCRQVLAPEGGTPSRSAAEQKTSEETSLQPVIRSARRATTRFELPANHTVQQRGLDELLQRLQDKGAFARSFSMPMPTAIDEHIEESPLVVRKDSKSSTHSGVWNSRSAMTSSTQCGTGTRTLSLEALQKVIDLDSTDASSEQAEFAPAPPPLN